VIVEESLSEGSITTTPAPEEESLSLCTELLSVLNNCSTAGNVGSVLLLVIRQWIESSALSVLLMPLMRSACRCLASMVHIVCVTETCIDSHFSLGMYQLLIIIIIMSKKAAGLTPSRVRHSLGDRKWKHIPPINRDSFK